MLLTAFKFQMVIYFGISVDTLKKDNLWKKITFLWHLVVLLMEFLKFQPRPKEKQPIGAEESPVRCWSVLIYSNQTVKLGTADQIGF